MFPEKKYKDIASYTDNYLEEYALAAASVDRGRLSEACEILKTAYRMRQTVFVCGNGGSAGISNHLVCDHLKGIQTDTSLLPKVFSLASNIEVITALANDISYDEVFKYQAERYCNKDDLIIIISSSGNSKTIVIFPVPNISSI